jgi:hypothetical protein
MRLQHFERGEWILPGNHGMPREDTLGGELIAWSFLNFYVVAIWHEDHGDVRVEWHALAGNAIALDPEHGFRLRNEQNEIVDWHCSPNGWHVLACK